tara:strand:+ start:76 stop:597 length:522 start_codon:yes stop_codon:yes gene_type:complete
MQILNWIPPHAQQIRYIAPLYEEDSDGDRYCYNDNECTQVWYDIIKQVHKTKRPMYYRRRTTELARRDKYQYQQSVYNENDWKNDWAKSIHVRVKVVGKRVVFIYDEEFVHKVWVASKNKKELRDKIRKLKEQKFKGYSEKILKLKDELNSDAIDNIIDNLWTPDSEELNEGR